MNLVVLFAIVMAVGGALVLVGRDHPPQEDGKAPAAIQFGYLTLVVGMFGFLAQFMSFAAVMLIFIVVSGVITALNKWKWAKTRPADALVPEPVEISRSFFPIITVVFLLRAFLAEPFVIPSSSMRPGLIPRDFILVNKFAYGIRMPILNNVLVDVGQPQRGDVVVFHYPVNDRVDFIKRLVALPGDVIEYRDKTLWVNGVQAVRTHLAPYTYADGDLQRFATEVYEENLLGKKHPIIVEEGKPTVFIPAVELFHNREACEYNDDGFKCRVPKGQYFMMGDNRDNGHDSRYWGFVSDKQIVGKAFFIWLNVPEFSRIGTVIQ